MTFYLACDGGATRTRAGLYDADGRLLDETEAGPCNPAEYGVAASVRILTAAGRALLPTRAAQAVELAAGISGAGEPASREVLGARLCQALGIGRVVVAPDLHTLLFANAGNAPAILAIAGTGSSVAVQDHSGSIIRVGGRGHVLGDAGSAYRIAEEALRAAARAQDRLDPPSALPEALRAAAGLAAFEDLAAWTLEAGKAQVAALAKAVAACAEAGDAAAAACIEGQARQLAEQVLAARAHAAMDAEAPVFTAGGLFEHCPLYASAFQAALAQDEALQVTEPAFRGHRAVYVLARSNCSLPWATVSLRRPVAEEPAEPTAEKLPPTEEGAETATPLDRMTAAQIVEHMNREDAGVAHAVGQQVPEIVRAVEAAARTIRQGGRILYVGAGTSGRLGVLDASECPPTFGIEPGRVVGIIAGGETALRDSVEGAEDDRQQGAAAMCACDTGHKDLVVGISASGSTPYVLAALDAARQRGAATALLTCNPECASTADIVIRLDTGPEVLAGSTRLKAGTATKMALNMISTGAMTLAGYVYEGLMVGVRPANAKLRRRAARIVARLGRVSEARAAAVLAEADYAVAPAILMARKGLNKEQAQTLLEACGGAPRDALE